MSNKDYQEIMTEITSNLTGDQDSDIEYLTNKCEEYKTHEMATEILRGIGRIMYDLLPDEKRERINMAIKNDSLGWKATLEEVDFCIYKKDFSKARVLIESLIDKLEASGLYKDDEVTEYKDFYEYFEEVIYSFMNKPEKTLRSPGYPFANIYLRYGGLLFEFHEHEKAKEALIKAVEWNPISAEIAFELAENYKATGDVETFFDMSKQAHKNCFRPATLARCYRNLAYYYTENKKYREAMACLIRSGTYDDASANLQSEMYFIQETNGGVRINLEPDEVMDILEKENIPIGPDQDVLGLSFALAKGCMDRKELNGAEYFLNIFYDLTGDEQTGKMLDTVRKTLAAGSGN